MLRGVFSVMAVLLTAACSNAKHEAEPSDEQGAAGASCGGSIVIATSEAELSCSTGVTAVGGGLYDLVLQAPPATELSLRLPSLETGSYSGADCLTGSVAFDGRLYVAAAEAELPMLRLTRDKFEVTGDITGNFCDVTQLPLRCITVSVPSFSATITSQKSDCSCASSSAGAVCEIGVCTPDGCAVQECPVSAASCTAR